MKGTIRTLLGLLVLFGVAGGIDSATDGDLVILALVGSVGIMLMYSGVTAMNENRM
jgi:hypothetical protein